MGSKQSLVPILQSRNKTLVIAVKNYAVADIKFFQFLPDFVSFLYFVSYIQKQPPEEFCKKNGS